MFDLYGAKELTLSVKAVTPAKSFSRVSPVAGLADMGEEIPVSWRQVSKGCALGLG